MRNLILFLSVIGLVLCCAQTDVLAHGGSHPTPWPVPPPDTPPPPPPTPPPPTPTPTPTPTPSPGGRTPTPTPSGQPAATPTGPAKKSGAGGVSKASWKKWWEINKWRFTWTSQRAAQESGGEEGKNQSQLIDFLLQQLGHSWYDVRSAAAIALGKAGDKRAVTPLRELCSDSNTTVVESAILALGMLESKESVPFLMEIFRSPKQSKRFRVYAGVSLGLAGDHSAAREMMTVASKKKEDDEVKAAALLGLALMKYEPGAALMIKILSSKKHKKHLRAVAASALGKLGVHYAKIGRGKVPVMKYLLQILQTCKKEHSIRQSSILAVPAVGPTKDFPREKLTDRLRQIYGDRNTDVQCLTLMAMAELAKEGKALDNAQYIFRSRLIKEKNHKIKSFAALAAGLSGDRESIDALRKILKGGANPSLRSAAAVGLGLLKDVGSTDLLLDLLGQKTDKNLKGYCCISLGLMGTKDNKEALPKLKDIVTNASDPELRAAAAMALTQLGESQVVRVLVDALADSNTYFKMSAVMAIGAFRDLSTVTSLIDVFNSDSVNDETRAIIIVALGHIAESREVPVLKKIGLHYNFLNEMCPTLLEIINLL